MTGTSYGALLSEGPKKYIIFYVKLTRHLPFGLLFSFCLFLSRRCFVVTRRLCRLCHGYLRRYPVYGRARVLPPRAASALGGVPEQVLQGGRVRNLAPSFDVVFLMLFVF